MITYTQMRPYPNKFEIIGILIFSGVMYLTQDGINTQSLLIILSSAGWYMYMKLYTSSYKAHYQSLINHRCALRQHRELSDQLDRQNAKLNKIMTEIRHTRNGTSITATEELFADWDKDDFEDRKRKRECRAEDDKELREEFKREVF